MRRCVETHAARDYRGGPKSRTATAPGSLFPGPRRCRSYEPVPHERPRANHETGGSGCRVKPWLNENTRILSFPSHEFADTAAGIFLKPFYLHSEHADVSKSSNSAPDALESASSDAIISGRVPAPNSHQRLSAGSDPFLKAADELAWRSTTPPETPRLASDDPKRKEPPLVYFSAKLRLSTAPPRRRSALRPKTAPWT